MKKRSTWLIHYLQLLGIAGIALFVLLAITSLFNPAHALPEYAHRTGEPCATCHVNPGGGGPRTLRGALWAARGKPDAVPALPNVLLAPGVTEGAELYQIACSTCHGSNGEGLFGRELANSGLKDTKIRSNVLKGRLQSGMPPSMACSPTRNCKPWWITLSHWRTEPLRFLPPNIRWNHLPLAVRLFPRPRPAEATNG